MTLARQIRSGLLWTAVQQWSVQAIRMGVLLVLARFVQPQEFGTFALASTIVGLVQLIHGQGITAAITQRHQLNRADLGAAFAALVASAIVAALALFLAAPYLAATSMPRLGSLLRALSLLLPLNAVSGVTMALWRRDLQFRRLAQVTTVSQWLASLCAVLLAIYHFGLWSLAARMLVEAVVLVLLTLRAAPWQTLRQATWQAYREVLRFGLPTAGSNLLALGRNRLDELILGATLGMESLGYYALARRQMDGIASLLPAVIGNTFIPILSRLQQDRQQVRTVLLRGIGLIGAFTLPALATMGAGAPTWVPLLLGERWRPAIPLIEGFAIIAATRALVGFNLVMLPATGHPGKRLLLELVTSVLSIGAVLLALPSGISAVVYASALCLLVLTPIELLWIGRWLPVRVRDQMATVAIPAGAAVLLVVLMLILQHGTWSASHLVVRAVFAVTATVAAILFCYRRLPALVEHPTIATQTS